MKIGIIGLGAVGTANKKGFESLGHEVIVHDIKLGTKVKDVLDTDVNFICVPTPANKDGSCDTSIVHQVIAQLCEYDYTGVICVRSTVEPGFTDKMIKYFHNKNICFAPEFLRERCAEDDFINNHTLLAIGSLNHSTYKIVVEAHGDLPKNTVDLKPAEAELLKYYNNVYASLRVTFANVFYEVCKKLDADYTKVKDSYILTGKAKDMYLDVNDTTRGYAGMCLPKDTKALIQLIKNLGLDYSLIESIENDNNKFKKTVFKGMRK